MIYIDEIIIEEPYIIFEGPGAGRMKRYGPISIPSDSAFVLGDNRTVATVDFGACAHK